MPVSRAFFVVYGVSSPALGSVRRCGSLESEGQRRANEYLRDVLQGKGYPVRYTAFSGGHTFLCWQGTLSDRLLALLGRDWGSPIPR